MQFNNAMYYCNSIDAQRYEQIQFAYISTIIGFNVYRLLGLYAYPVYVFYFLNCKAQHYEGQKV